MYLLSWFADERDGPPGWSRGISWGGSSRPWEAASRKEKTTSARTSWWETQLTHTHTHTHTDDHWRNSDSHTHTPDHVHFTHCGLLSLSLSLSLTHTRKHTLIHKNTTTNILAHTIILTHAHKNKWNDSNKVTRGTSPYVTK